jgi:exodeoxyribonuclease V beta subunit
MTDAVPLQVFDCPLQGVRLIEASAGTGKTWNICGLYLRLLLERGLAVQQVLVVTFTNAATAELRDRIRNRIAEVLARLEGGAAQGHGDTFVDDFLSAMRARGLEDGDMTTRLTRALRTFDEAAIFTIHGFCKRALDDAPFAAGLPLAQELTEDDGDLRHEVAADFWRNHVAGAGLPAALADWLVRTKESPQRWADMLRRHSAKPLAKVEWPDDIDAPADAELPAEAVTAFDRARALWLADRDTIVQCVIDGFEGLNRTSYKDFDVVHAAAQVWDATLLADEPHVLPSGDDLKKLALLGSGRLKPKAGHAACRKHPFFAEAQALVDAWTAHKDVLDRGRWQIVRQLVDQGPTELRNRKRSRRVVAFDDMLFNLYDRLKDETGAALAAVLRKKFPAALIDEFQDTDPLQFTIFDRVYAAGEDSLLFLVGDPKQAIYSFRNADLHTYLKARERAVAEYTLQHNQRSTPQLLAAMNALFGANPQAFQLPGLTYRPVEAGAKKRKPFVDRTQARAALQLWNLPADGGPLEKQDARERAVRACAAEIARLLAAAQDGQVLHDSRPLEAGDIAVLVRSHQEGSDIREALLALGVGSVELRQTSVFRTPDASELQTLLLAVAQPSREPLLRSALATELLGLDAAAIEQLSEDEADVLARIDRFDKYRQLWRDRGIAPMLRELFTQEGVHERMLRRPDGERRLTNLRHLSELLNEAAQEHPGTEALLRWLQRQRHDAQASDATQVRLESDLTLVQIVTIHKSKGLEYPIVFCPFLWNGHPGGRDRLPGYEYHDAGGRTVIDYRPADDAVKEATRSEKDAERLRLAYVALTRAIHRCYLVVGAYKVKTGQSFSTKECARNPLNWLVAGNGTPVQRWPKNDLPPAAITQAWRELAAGAAGATCRRRRAAGWNCRVPRPNDWSHARRLQPLRRAGGSPATARSRMASGVSRMRPRPTATCTPPMKAAGRLQWRPTTSSCSRAARVPAKACMRCSRTWNSTCRSNGPRSCSRP